MDIEFEHDMQRLLHAHMEDAMNHFVKYKGYSARAFIYTGYEFTPYNINSERMEEEMKDIQDKACMMNATAVSIVGVFDLFRAVGDTYDEAIERCNESNGENFVALAVIMKLMDGKTFSIMHEVVEENGETRLNEAVYAEDQEFFKIPIKPWGN
jgi:hypothetical protein